MSTRIEREGGGYFTCPNRWFDAGYAKQVPATITSVYMFLCRWEGLHIENESSQPIPTIARQCGCSPDVARDAVRVLEEWDVLHRTPARGPKGENVWLLKALQKIAPETPYQPKKGRKTTPHKKNEGSEKNHGEKNETYQPEVNQPLSSLHEDAAAGIKSSPKEKPIDLQIMDAFCEETGLAKFASFAAARKQAQQLAKADFTPDEVRELIKWLRAQAWITSGISLGLCLNQADQFRTARTNRKSVAQGGGQVVRKADTEASQKAWDDIMRPLHEN